jgi:RNA polymerase sigma-70 factor (ECF subfamily)
MERLVADSNIKSWLLTIQRNVWLNQVRRRRHGPQMSQTELGEDVASSLIEPSKGPHDLYVTKIEVEQVRAANPGAATTISRSYPVARI